MENNMEVPLKAKNRNTIWPSNLTHRQIPRENHIIKRYVHPNVHWGTIYNSQDMEATYMSINRGMAKEDVVHICNAILEKEMAIHSRTIAWKIPWTEEPGGMAKEDMVHIYDEILLSCKKRNKIVPFAEMWMDLETHTEWHKAEREKQKLYNTINMWILEKWYRWTFLQSRNRDTDIENKPMYTKGGIKVGWIRRLGLTYTHCAVLCLVAQACPTLCDSMDCSLPGSSVHGDSRGKNTGVGCHALLPIYTIWTK